MDFLINLFWLVLGFVLLSKGADWFVDGAAGIATKLKIPQIVIGLTIVAMGTSAPEAAVSISSALKGSAEITIGNVVGSNIINVLIILGVSGVITALAVQKSTKWVDIPVTIGLTVLLLLMGLDGNITLIDGIILLVCFVAYLTYLFVMTKKHPEQAEEAALPADSNKKHFLLKAILMSVVGLAAIVLGSNCAVDGATGIATFFGVSDRIIGLTVIALGTSLPELFTSVTAALKKNSDIAIGNIVGSNLFNILMVVGLSSVITTVPFDSKFIVDILFAIGAMLILFLSCIVFKKVGRITGIVMLVLYAVYFVYLLMTGSETEPTPEAGEQLSSAASSIASALTSMVG
ncbi:MAG: calcium/sodium antiporter [Clostridia bacterium]|nr:calcium/sodium antiporter [Clostridia bacterium]